MFIRSVIALSRQVVSLSSYDEQKLVIFDVLSGVKVNTRK